jgi:hypothetical protein
MPIWSEKRNVMEKSAFELSRIYGRGWNTAKKLLAAGTIDVDHAQAAAFNPYRTAPESARWADGFSAAIKSRAAPFQTAGTRAWRPMAAE